MKKRGRPSISHAADIDKSARLKKLLEILADGFEYSTAELQERTGSMAIHTDIHELRSNGYAVKCRYVGKHDDKKVYAYKLEVPN
jgi:DeoR/GlpR family transcriptional regulator of sugar metabolism